MRTQMTTTTIGRRRRRRRRPRRRRQERGGGGFATSPAAAPSASAAAPPRPVGPTARLLRSVFLVYLLLAPSHSPSSIGIVVVHGWNIFPLFNDNNNNNNQQQQQAVGAAAGPPFDGGGAQRNPAAADPRRAVPRKRNAAAAAHNNNYGPEDARHIRWLPDVGSGAVVMRKIRKSLKTLLLYKPPVGIALLWVSIRLFFRSTITSGTPLSSSFRDLLFLDDSGSKRRRRRTGRSLDIDAIDRCYDDHGGVDSARARLCETVLDDFVERERDRRERVQKAEGRDAGDRAASLPPPPSMTKSSSLFPRSSSNSSPSSAAASSTASASASDDEMLETASIALDALRIAVPPRGSREWFVEQCAEPMSRLSKALSSSSDSSSLNHQRRPPSNATGGGGRDGARSNKRGVGGGGAGNTADDSPSPPPQSPPPPPAPPHHALAQAVRLVELRTLDALLRVLRDRLLASTSRLRRAERYWSWRVRVYERIGVQWRAPIRKALRQPSLDDDRRKFMLASAAYGAEMERLGHVQRVLLDRPDEIASTELLHVLGKERTSDRSAEAAVDAAKVLREADDSVAKRKKVGGGGKASSSSWSDDAAEWSKRARSVVRTAVTASMEGPSASDPRSKDATISTDASFLTGWSEYDESSCQTADGWRSVLTLVENVAHGRRQGETRYYRFGDGLRRLRRWDLLGIPSSAIAVAAAYYVHNTVKPHWPKVVEAFRAIVKAIWGIIEFRFYTPLKDIILDLLNRRPRMLDPFALFNEEQSLDYMLKDLGVGDGTPQGRVAAVAAASRLYEEELRVGAVRGLFRGKMVRLLLIQVQQLKADLLKAMDSIDDLVDANRLNVQLLASIPAFLMLYFGSRLFLASLYNLRTKDLRLPKDVHAEMSEYLSKIEKVLLLANHEMDMAPTTKQRPPSSAAESREATTFLKPNELGEFVLLVHSYLILLDYMSPPFPGKACDSIHRTIQDLLMQGQISTRRQLDLLKLIQSKHAALLKSL